MPMEKPAPLTTALEDYLVTIFKLEAAGGAARASDIATAQNVSRSTVTSRLCPRAGSSNIHRTVISGSRRKESPWPARSPTGTSFCGAFSRMC